MNALTEFFGRLHPVLVHLPIGFLILALVLQWLNVKEKYFGILPAVRVSFLLGMISAILSCLSGWTLSSGGEYDEATLSFHKWFGISVAILSIIGYVFSARPSSIVKRVVAFITIILIIITGHLGGTLTHGDSFLTKGIFVDKTDSAHQSKKIIANVQDAFVFADIIQPVLTDKCGGCHSAKKQKGGLRLDAKEWILKGGKDGQVFTTGNAEASDLYKRLVLDPLEEKHMPPKGKPPLTEQEINLLHWWISSNAAFDKKVKEVPQPAQIKTALLALQSTEVLQKPSIPTGDVEKAPGALIDSLRNAGIIVLPVAVNSNYLLANFVSIPKLTDQTVSLLRLISKQLAWLKLSYTNLSDNSWKIVAQCDHLTRLSIEHTNITDTTLLYLSHLNHLQYLNLVGDKVTAQGTGQLKGLHELGNLYLGQTLVTANDLVNLQKLFPKTMLDLGNYHLENLATDTQLLKAPPVKK
jgi:uncharacterized membrane protein/mono/diheme cytochrome c family protein